MILHIDMDAFFASIEQAINPHFKGKPLIVDSRGSKMHTVVCAASYEAKRLGIHSGMSSAEAFKICPNLEFIAAAQGKYIWTSEQIFCMLQEYKYPINYASIDEFQLDIADHRKPLELAAKIQVQIYANFNISASIGISKNWLLAKLASKIKKPNGITLIDDANFEAVLKQAPLNKLCGMNGKTGASLSEQGLKSCWDLYLKDPGYFDDENPGKFEETQNTKPKSIGHSYTLPRASQNPRFIHAWIRLLSEMVGERLRHKNLAARTVHLWLSGPQIGQFGAQKTFQQATSDSFEIYQRALKLKPGLALKTPQVRAIGVTASGLEPAEPLSLLIEHKKRSDLIGALDRINSRFGEGSVYPAQVMFTRKISDYP